MKRKKMLKKQATPRKQKRGRNSNPVGRSPRIWPTPKKKKPAQKTKVPSKKRIEGGTLEEKIRDPKTKNERKKGCEMVSLRRMGGRRTETERGEEEDLKREETKYMKIKPVSPGKTRGFKNGGGGKKKRVEKDSIKKKETLKEKKKGLTHKERSQIIRTVLTKEKRSQK